MDYYPPLSKGDPGLAKQALIPLNEGEAKIKIQKARGALQKTRQI
jgi:hypothetical protein